MFRNPVNALKSRYSIQHCQNVEGNWRDLPELLSDYAQQGQDRFGLEAHFDAWTQSPRSSRNYEICCLRYETVWEHLKELLDYLEIDRRHLDKIPQKRETKRPTDETTEAALTQMYQPLIDKIDRFPEFTVI